MAAKKQAKETAVPDPQTAVIHISKAIQILEGCGGPDSEWAFIASRLSWAVGQIEERKNPPQKEAEANDTGTN